MVVLLFSSFPLLSFLPSSPSSVPPHHHPLVASGPPPPSFRPLGILSNETTTSAVLPLLGRPLHANRNQWQYATLSNQYNQVPLQVWHHGKNAMSDQGIPELYTGDTVHVTGDKETRYVVELYTR